MKFSFNVVYECSPQIRLSRLIFPVVTLSISRLLYRMFFAPYDDLQSRLNGKLMEIERPVSTVLHCKSIRLERLCGTQQSRELFFFSNEGTSTK